MRNSREHMVPSEQDGPTLGFVLLLMIFFLVICFFQARKLIFVCMDCYACWITGAGVAILCPFNSLIKLPRDSPLSALSDWNQPFGSIPHFFIEVLAGTDLITLRLVDLEGGGCDRSYMDNFVLALPHRHSSCSTTL
ncbi:hypothetical protein F5Y16DRAFT_228678 [Xylariaceae sp. FL0255]|nr:hypothetical protein F5Y16DRAFT_228678 [Xylariaceae sp. FL0255]